MILCHGKAHYPLGGQLIVSASNFTDSSVLSCLAENFLLPLLFQLVTVYSRLPSQISVESIQSQSDCYAYNRFQKRLPLKHTLLSDLSNSKEPCSHATSQNSLCAVDEDDYSHITLTRSFTYLQLGDCLLPFSPFAPRLTGGGEELTSGLVHTTHETALCPRPSGATLWNS